MAPGTPRNQHHVQKPLSKNGPGNSLQAAGASGPPRPRGPVRGEDGAQRGPRREGDVARPGSTALGAAPTQWVNPIAGTHLSREPKTTIQTVACKRDRHQRVQFSEPLVTDSRQSSTETTIQDRTAMTATPNSAAADCRGQRGASQAASKMGGGCSAMPCKREKGQTTQEGRKLV